MRGKLFVMGLASLVASSAAFALTASNNVAATTAGQGLGTISGYSVVADSVAYDVDNTDPTVLNRVTFTISPAAANTVKVKLNTAWHTCANAAGTITCPATGVFSGETVAGATALNVVAIQNTDS